MGVGVKFGDRTRYREGYPWITPNHDIGYQVDNNLPAPPPHHHHLLRRRHRQKLMVSNQGFINTIIGKGTIPYYHFIYAHTGWVALYGSVWSYCAD